MVRSQLLQRRPSLCFLVMLVALAASSALSEQKNPLAGTWQANISKSQRDPNHLFKSVTLRFEISDDVVSITYTGVKHVGKRRVGSCS